MAKPNKLGHSTRESTYATKQQDTWFPAPRSTSRSIHTSPQNLLFCHSCGFPPLCTSSAALTSGLCAHVHSVLPAAPRLSLLPAMICLHFTPVPASFVTKVRCSAFSSGLHCDQFKGGSGLFLQTPPPLKQNKQQPAQLPPPQSLPISQP